VDADAELDALGRRNTCVLVVHRFLHFDSAAQGVDDAGELDQQAVAGGLYDAASMLGDLRVRQFAPDCPQTCKRPFLVSADQPAVAGYIRRQYRC